MPTSKPTHLSVIALLVVSLACVAPTITVVNTPDANFVNTAIAQTMNAVLTQSALSATPIPQASETAAVSSTPETPTASPTITLTPTPLFTFTPSVPMITVSLDTNCRIGPGKAYDRVGALLVGEYAQVIARDPTGEYWYISNPDGSGYCWLWGEYAILSGNYVALPIFTPPPTPTPTPNFEASYKSLDNCSGWWVDIRLKNTGGTPFVSMSMSVRDTVTDSLVSYSRDGFTNIDSCSDSTTTGTLRPGDVLTVSSPLFAYDPTGHKLRATIELCTNTDQTGTCVKQVITFTPE